MFGRFESATASVYAASGRTPTRWNRCVTIVDGMASPVDSTSWSLVLGAAAAVPADREEFGRRYGPVIAGYFAARWRLPVGHERVDDARQEVLLRCFSPGGPLERVDPARSGGFRAYLRGVVGRVASELERKMSRRARREARGFEPDDVAALQSTPSEAFDRGWAEMVTDQAWAVMADKARGHPWAELRLRVLGMRYADGLAPREIAAAIDELGVRQVRRMVATGRHHFRTAMMHVLSGYHPDLSSVQLEQKCRELIDLL